MNTHDKLTYETFLRRVSERADGSIADIDRFLHRIGPAVENLLKQDGRASIAGFGSFDLREIAERPGHDPHTNETTTVAAHTHVHFSPFQALKRAVNWPHRLGRIRLFPREGADARGHRWKMFAVPVLLLLMVGLAIWAFWIREPAGQQATAPAATAAPAEPETATNAEAAPVAAASAAPAPADAFPAQSQVVVERDTFWDLSGALWGDTAWWPLLYVENRADLPVAHPDRLPVGISLQVPALEGGPAAPSADDLKRLTAAYDLVGRDYKGVNNRRAADYLRVSDRGFSP